MTELDTLLDDALADFEEENVRTISPVSDSNKSSSCCTSTDKTRLPDPQDSPNKGTLSGTACSDNTAAPDPPLPDLREFLNQVSREDEEQYISDLTKEFDKAFSDLLNSTPELRANLSSQQLPQDAVPGNMDAVPGNMDALPGNMDADIARTMENLFRDAAAAGETSTQPEENVEGMVPVLESLLSKLLSKEILHEPLQELLNMYPEWLENNTNHPKFAVYQKQKLIVQNICDIFNGPNYKNEGGKVYALLNDMQETGPPPEEIVSKMSSEIPDAMKNGPPPPPMMGDNPEQCCIQ